MKGLQDLERTARKDRRKGKKSGGTGGVMAELLAASAHYLASNGRIHWWPKLDEATDFLGAMHDMAMASRQPDTGESLRSCIEAGDTATLISFASQREHLGVLSVWRKCRDSLPVFLATLDSAREEIVALRASYEAERRAEMKTRRRRARREL